MRTDYPNIELLAYRADRIFDDELGKYLLQEKELFVRQLDTQAYVFRQTWPSTATGLDMYGGFSGQALTSAYTTIVQIDFETQNPDPEIGIIRNNFFVVFFRDTLAYFGFNPNESFYSDISNYNMKSQREQRYFVKDNCH